MMNGDKEKDTIEIKDNEKYVYIYTLSDPRNNEIRYVGKTKQKLNNRLSSHLSEIKRGNKNHRCNWIRKLLKEDIKPKIDILDIVPECEWKFWETYWISQMKQWGLHLVNGSNGGEGGDNLNKEQIEELRKRMIENNPMFISEVVEKCSKRMTKWLKIKWKDPSYRNKMIEISKKGCKPVIQYSINGKFIKEYKSITDAAKILGITPSSIYGLCRGNKWRKTAHGYVWKYKD